MSGPFYPVHLLSQGGESVDQDLQSPLQSAQAALHVCVALLQLLDLLVLLPSCLESDELLHLRAEAFLLVLHTLNALFHIKRVSFQHAETLVKGVHVEPQQLLKAGVSGLQAGCEQRGESGDCPVGGAHS